MRDLLQTYHRPTRPATYPPPRAFASAATEVERRADECRAWLVTCYGQVTDSRRIWVRLELRVGQVPAIGYAVDFSANVETAIGVFPQDMLEQLCEVAIARARHERGEHG